MKRNIVLERTERRKNDSECQVLGHYKTVREQIEISEDATDEDIIDIVSKFIGGPVCLVAITVYESCGDVRLYYDGVWRYVEAVSDKGIQAMKA